MTCSLLVHKRRLHACRITERFAKGFLQSVAEKIESDEVVPINADQYALRSFGFCGFVVAFSPMQELLAKEIEFDRSNDPLHCSPGTGLEYGSCGSHERDVHRAIDFSHRYFPFV